MRVLFLGARFDRSELAFCRHMAERPDIEFHVVCEPASGINDLVRNTNCPITDLTFRSRLDPGAVRLLKRKFSETRFDIAHAVTNRALSNVLLAARGLPVKVIGYRGTMGHVSRFDPASWLTYLNPGLDRIICVADAVRDYLRSVGVPAKKLTTVYKGHDASWYAGGPTPAPAAFGVPDNAFTVCFAGDMRPVKGVSVLLDAATRPAEPHNIHFILAGEVRDRRIRRMMDSGRIPGFVHFIGHRRNAFELIRACNAFVMPSLAREGLPRAVIEAMVQSVPPIVSRVGGMPELVTDGETGLVVPPGDPAALADAIARLRSDPDTCAELGRAAKQRIETHFNIRETIGRTIDVYRELCR